MRKKQQQTDKTDRTRTGTRRFSIRAPTARKKDKKTRKNKKKHLAACRSKQAAEQVVHTTTSITLLEEARECTQESLQGMYAASRILNVCSNAAKEVRQPSQKTHPKVGETRHTKELPTMLYKFFAGVMHIDKRSPCLHLFALLPRVP